MDTLVKSKSSVRRGYSAICTPRKKSCCRCYQISRLSSPVLCFPVNVGRAKFSLLRRMLLNPSLLLRTILYYLSDGHYEKRVFIQRRWTFQTDAQCFRCLLRLDVDIV